MIQNIIHNLLIGALCVIAGYFILYGFLLFISKVTEIVVSTKLRIFKQFAEKEKEDLDGRETTKRG